MLKDTIARLKNQLITGNEFQNILIELMNHEFNGNMKILYELKDKTNEIYIYGESGEGIPSISYYENLEEGYSVHISVWQNELQISQEELKELFFAYWNKEYCDNICGLPATSKRDFQKKCDNSIKAWKQEGKSVAVVMLDLDHFKEVNEKYNHEKGTQVISEFSHILFKMVYKNAILIHQSGDEFNLLFTFKDYTEILNLIYMAYKEIKMHDFGIADIDITMAVGVWIVGEEDEAKLTTLRIKAEDTYSPKRRNCAKNRDSIRIDKKGNCQMVGNNDLELAFVRVISNLYTKNLFNNIYLDYISNKSSHITHVAEIGSELNEFLRWVNPEYNSGLRSTALSEKADTKAILSYVEVGLATLHGLLKNKEVDGKSLKFEINSGIIKIIVDGKDILYFSDESIEGNLNWDIPQYNIVKENVDTRKTVFVQAGYSTKINLPEDIFFRVERVDARPTIGGGLPDFWAATLSALVNYLNINPNFRDIVIYGDVENIKNVKQYLDTIEEWDDLKIKYISKKTYKEYDEIVKFRDKFSKHVSVYVSEKEIISHLFDLYKDFDGLEGIRKKVEKDDKRFMKRNLSYDKLCLRITDGCHTNSIAQAFPIALEILRNSSNKQNIIVDQAGRQLLELTDFKIVLDNPTIDRFPEYYYYDRDEIKQYYKKNFVDDNGLFIECLNEKNQLDEMIKHVVTSINAEKPYTTRRAILIIPNKVNGDNYSPLGLISIRLSPRFKDQSVIIDFSYTWRTVEALVGLPLSMFASVSFAEDIVKRIVASLSDKTMQINMGKVSYIAHSLHMFTDEESMNIVRGIINEVSV